MNKLKKELEKRIERIIEGKYSKPLERELKVLKEYLAFVEQQEKRDELIIDKLKKELCIFLWCSNKRAFRIIERIFK